MPDKSVGKRGTIRADKLEIKEIDIPNTDSGNVGTLKLSDNLEIGGDGLILTDLEEFVSGEHGKTITYADNSTATATVEITQDQTGSNTLTSSVSKTISTPENITLNSKVFLITQSGTTITLQKFMLVDNGQQIVYTDSSTATATVSGDNTNTLTSSVSKSIITPENITLNGKTFLITQFETTITIKNNQFVSGEHKKTITYADGVTASNAIVSVAEGESGTNTLTSSVSKSISDAEDITLNGKTFSITQSGTTVTIDQTDTKKIISLEQGNLVLATYNTETGARTNKEVIFDSNNSISEINGASYDLKVKSLDVTTSDTIDETIPSAGDARIDGSLTLGGTLTSKGTNSNLLIDPNGTGSLTLGSADNTGVNINGAGFSITGNGTSSTITMVTNGDSQDLTIGITGDTNSSLILESSGNSTDAVQLTASAGGMDITSSGVMDITTSASNSNINIDPNGSGTLALGSSDNTAVTIDALAITATSVNALTLTDGIATMALGGTGATSISGATTLDLDSSRQLQINSSNGTIDIGNDDVGQAINIGTNGNRTITIGGNNAKIVIDSSSSKVSFTGEVHTSDITEIQDPLFIIGGTGNVNNDPESDDNKDRGILFKYHNGTSAKKGFFGFDDSENEFTFIPDAGIDSEVISGDKGTISCATIKFDSIGSNWTAASRTCADLGTITTVDINGGTIDGTTIATSDITVGTGKTLNVSAGTLTLADDQISGDKVEGGTINATTITTLESTTGNIATVNSTTVDTTNIEVTNIKAKDGTSAGSIADSTGVITLASSVLTTTDINGGTIDGTTIATSDITVGAGKTLNVSAGTLTLADNQISGDKVEGGTIASITISQLDGAMDCNSQAMTNVNIDSGAIDGTVIGGSSEAAGTFTTLDIKNTTNDASGAILKFTKNRGSDAVDGDDIGDIQFWSYDDGTPSTQQYASIIAEVSDATSGQEGGLLSIKVAEHDGTLTTGLKIEDGDADGELDVTIGAGTSSVTTVSGDLKVTTDIILDDGGSLKEAGGTAAFTFDGDGHVTKIGQDSPSSGQFLKWDGSKAVWDSGGSGATQLNELPDVLIDATDFTDGFLIQPNSDGSAPTTGTLSGANNNIGIGIDVFKDLTSGDDNICLGNESGRYLTSGIENIGIGKYALRGNSSSKITGGNNIAIGENTLYSLSSGSNNIAIGGKSNVDGALTDLTTGSDNICIGSASGRYITTGSNNVAIGNSSLCGTTLTTSSTAVGYLSGQSTTGSYNAFFGYFSGRDVTSGTFNTLIGFKSGESTSSNELTGHYNTAVGAYSGENLQGSATNNTLLGYQAGDSITTGSGNIIIGKSADVSGATVSNETVIGYNATGQGDNTVTLGNSDVTTIYMAQDSGASVHCNFLIQSSQTINVGGSGIIVTNTSYTTAPTSSIINLVATSATDNTYIWTLDSWSPTAGTTIHLFFDNSADTGVLLKITFGNKLLTGNGTNDALTFSTNGQSASIIYLDSKWKIFNTGAAVS